MKQSLKVKLEMAKFLQQTLDDMAVESKGHKSEAAKEFHDFMLKVKSQIVSFFHLFLHKHPVLPVPSLFPPFPYLLSSLVFFPILMNPCKFMLSYTLFSFPLFLW